MGKVVAVVLLDFLAATHTSFFPTLLHVCNCFLTVRTAPGFLHGVLATCAVGVFCTS